jgi:hypothetical protein
MVGVGTAAVSARVGVSWGETAGAHPARLTTAPSKKKTRNTRTISDNGRRMEFISKAFVEYAGREKGLLA